MLGLARRVQQTCRVDWETRSRRLGNLTHFDWDRSHFCCLFWFKFPIAHVIMDYRNVRVQKRNVDGRFAGNRLDAAHVVGKLLESAFKCVYSPAGTQLPKIATEVSSTWMYRHRGFRKPPGCPGRTVGHVLRLSVRALRTRAANFDSGERSPSPCSWLPTASGASIP